MKGSPPLKIAFDAKRLFHNREGLGSYARTLVSSLQTYLPQHEYYLCTPSLSEEDYAKPFLDQGKYSHILPPKASNKSLWRSKGMTKDLKALDIDVYWGLSNELPIGIAQVGCRSLVTIHDLFYLKYPKQFKFLDRQIISRKYAHAIKEADRILVASHHTQSDLKEHFPKALQKVNVTYQATQYEEVDAFIRPNDVPYYICVGSVTQRKNLELIIRAFAQLETQHRRKVLIVGRETSYADELKRLIKRLGLEEWYIFLGVKSDKELQELYAGAVALLFPSQYEGFGIPIIEALQLGIPVIGNNASSIPEMVGKHGIIIEYNGIESMSAAIIKMNDSEFRSRLMDNVDSHLEQFKGSSVVKNIEKILTELT